MPLILATGAPTASGHAYEDVYGVQYEFPSQYRNMVVEGERFVYYRGRRGSRDGVPAYLGDGIVGETRDSLNQGMRVVMVHDVTTFPAPLSFKSPDGSYRETGLTTQSNWANGVRHTSDEVFERIVGAAMGGSDGPTGASGFHADPAHAGRMERYSVAAVMHLLETEFGAELVHEMPPGNPGYDIEVRADSPLHVEVKGTILAEPVFHLSEGQRRHADLMGDQFRIYVVYGIDVNASTHNVEVCSGRALATRASLQPASWTGVMLPAR